MNIHEAVLQPIAAFVYCNRQAAANRRRQTKVGNFRAPAGACATNSAHFAKIIMVALCNRADHYIFALWFLSSSSFFLLFSSPNLRGWRLDVYHTSTHGVALMRI